VAKNLRLWCRLTSNIDFGIELAAILEGQQPIPPQGARFDAGFSRRATGGIAGRVAGTDYACLRPDGCFELNLRGVIETDDDCRIALMASGVGVMRPDEPGLELSEILCCGDAVAHLPLR
jgi:hypothetical protein